MNELQAWLQQHSHKICTNRLPSKNSHGGHYLHPDLDKMAAKAREAGKEYFYHEPVDPNNECGKQVECPPRYVYKIDAMTEEEYKKLVGEGGNQND